MKKAAPYILTAVLAFILAVAVLSNGINSDASVQKYKEEAASLGKSLEREEKLRKDAEEQLDLVTSRVAGAVSVPDEITVRDGDLDWRLIDGPIYLAPYTILDGEHMASAFGSSMTLTKGRLVRVRAACMAASDAGEADDWLQIELDMGGNCPAVWIRRGDTLPYDETTMHKYTGPFEYISGLNDPVTGEEIRFLSDGRELTPEEVGGFAEMYVDFDSVDLVLEKGIGRISWRDKDTGRPVNGPAGHVSLDDLIYPELESHKNTIG